MLPYLDFRGALNSTFHNYGSHGFIFQALWGGRVIDKPGHLKDRGTTAIDETNKIASRDSRVHNYLANIADGAHVIFKKH